MIWDKLAKKYDRLWVQRYSLNPTRKEVIAYIKKLGKKEASLVDLGCGTGQLLFDIYDQFEDYHLTGIDKSKGMIDAAKEKAKGTHIQFFEKQVEALTQAFADIKVKTDIITCTHSFPYYKDKQQALKDIAGQLRDDGAVIFAHASINNVYDKMVMYFIEKTAEKADYLSNEAFLALIRPYFYAETVFTIRKKWFMPSIYGYVLRKRQETSYEDTLDPSQAS